MRLASALAPLIAARIVQGIGAAIMTALTVAFVAEAVPKERTGRTMGLLGTMSAVGTALGPTLGGALIAAVGWRSMFFVLAVPGLIAFVLAWRYLPADGSRSLSARARFDKGGTLLLTVTLTAYALAMTIGRGRFGTVNLVLLAAAVAGGALFLIIEARTPSPLLPLTMFRKPALAAGFSMSAIVTTVVMATLVVGPYYLALALGLGAGSVGLVMSTGPLVAALSGVPAGHLVDRFGATHIALTALIVMFAGSSLIAVIPRELGAVGYGAPLVLITAGYAAFQAANNTAVMTGVLPEQRGVVSGVLGLSRNLGLITGAAVMGALFAFATGTNNIASPTAETVATGMRLTFAAAAALIAVALFIARGERR